jgi:hypothetical protein
MVLEPTLTIRVDTAAGVFMRRVRPATLLPTDVRPGDAAQDATRDAAAFWGLPDFIFRPALQARGSGDREIGDALVIVGDLGASVQVKARPFPTTLESRERSWLDKSIRKAKSQALGTIRSLKSAQSTALMNERGRQVRVIGGDKKWLSIVILDHPGIGGYTPDGGAVVLLRRDWEFLFEQLKSTYAVLEYLRRVADKAPVPLGDEPVRYYELAAADAATSPGPGDPRLASLGQRVVSMPLLPQAPAGQMAPNFHLTRLMLEDIASVPLPEGADWGDRLAVLAAIDAAPVAYREQLGTTLLGWVAGMEDVEDELIWRFRLHAWPDRPHLVFGAASRLDEQVQDEFGLYVALRHQQHIEVVAEQRDVMTVGVLLTPRHDGFLPCDTTVCATRRDQGFDEIQRAAAEEIWGKLGYSTPQDPDGDNPGNEDHHGTLRQGDHCPA